MDKDSIPHFQVSQLKLTGSFVVNCIHYGINLNQAELEANAVSTDEELFSKPDHFA